MSYDHASTISPDSVCTGIVEHPVRMQSRSELHVGASLGAFAFLNVGSIVYGGVKIGRYFSCGRGAEIGVVAHPTEMLSTHGFVINSSWFPKIPDYGTIRNSTGRSSLSKATEIGNDVWVGAQAIVVAGVNIASGAVIGANSVVTKDVLPYEIVGGVPAKHIRFRFPQSIIDELLVLAWWDLPFEIVNLLPFENIDECITQIRCAKIQETP